MNISRQFASKDGQKVVNLYVWCIVKTMAEMIEPYIKSIRSSLGSGGMFVQSLKFYWKSLGNVRNISIYGQENPTTWN